MTCRDVLYDVSYLPHFAVTLAPMTYDADLCVAKRHAKLCVFTSVESLKWWRDSLRSEISDSGALDVCHFVRECRAFACKMYITPYPGNFNMLP